MKLQPQPSPPGSNPAGGTEIGQMSDFLVPPENQAESASTPERVPANPTLHHAQEYASLGLRVIPVHERSKKPLLDEWPEKATIDPAVIEGWFSNHPEWNLGIAGGKGIVILDVDLNDAGPESLTQLIAEHGPLPATAEAFTGSGGSHYLFRVDPIAIVRNRVGIRPGLDIRADGGFIVAAPSIHPETGNRYSWITPPREGIAPIPACLMMILGSTDGSTPGNRDHAGTATGA